MKNDVVQAKRLKAFLLKIYHCKKDFELLVIDKKPKTRAGVYISDKQRIRVYSKWRCSMSLEEIAIHEYACPVTLMGHTFRVPNNHLRLNDTRRVFFTTRGA